MGSAGTIWDIADVITKARMNQKTTFVGTGAEINAISPTYAGQHAYCTSSGNGFVAGEEYKRDSANGAWKSASAVTGEIKFGGWLLASIPLGYLLCDASAVSRTTYAELFAAVSTRFGVGDGSTTFNLPDLRSVFPRGTPAATEAGGTGGESTHVLTTAELASHTHAHTIAVSNGSNSGGNGSGSDYTQARGTGTLDWWRPATITGSITSAGSSTAHENKPPFQNFVGIIAF